MKKNSPLHGVKDQVLKVPAYTLRAYDAPVKMNQNENPYDFPDDLKEEVFRRFRGRKWSRYPDFVPDSLRSSLAAAAGWTKDGILVGNGSNDLLEATLLVLVRERAPVGIAVPTFAVYGLVARILGARLVEIPLRDDMNFDVEAIVNRVEEAGLRVLILCSPNNPTGSVLAKEDLRRILERFAGHVVLDEAYFEFCGCTGLEFLHEFPRLVITRTFSKAMGMAGLRVGYLMAHPELAAQISKAKLPYNVNQFSLTAAEVALENPSRFRAAIEAVLVERERLGRELAAIPGIRLFPTGANFFLIRLEAPARAVFEDLCQRGVLVRDVTSYPMLSGCLRVTVGTAEENDKFLAAFRESVEKNRPPAAAGFEGAQR